MLPPPNVEKKRGARNALTAACSVFVCEVKHSKDFICKASRTEDSACHDIELLPASFTEQKIVPFEFHRRIFLPHLHKYQKYFSVLQRFSLFHKRGCIFLQFSDPIYLPLILSKINWFGIHFGSKTNQSSLILLPAAGQSSFERRSSREQRARKPTGEISTTFSFNCCTWFVLETRQLIEYHQSN